MTEGGVAKTWVRGQMRVTHMRDVLDDVDDELVVVSARHRVLGQVR